MANSNTDISLLAGLSEDSSYDQILKDIQAIQKRLEASGVTIKLNIEMHEKMLKNLNLKDVEKAFDNASNRMSQALIKKFGIVDKETKTEIKSLVNELKYIRLDEINTGNVSDNFEATLQKLNTVVSKNATIIKDNLSDALSESLTKEVSKMEATISAMNLKTSTDGVEKEANAMAQVEDSAKTAAVQKEKFAEANKEVAKTAGTTTNAINDEVNAFMDMNNLDSILNGLNYSGQQGSSIFNTLGDSFRNAFSAYSLANLLERALDGVVDTGKEAVEVVKELSNEAVSLRMATGGTMDDARGLVNAYNELGQELGAITIDVSESADAWLRQGHSIEDTNELIRDSMILSKISNLESAESTEYLTAIMNAYKLKAEEVLGVVDRLSNVDLHAAVDAGGIAEAMSKTAVSAQLAGVTMDELISMATVVGEVSQAGMSEVGNSLRTIFSRMKDVRDGNLSKIGSDGVIEDLSNIEGTLAAVGVQLRSSNNEFRNMFTVLDETAEKWVNMTSVQKAGVSEAYSGIRQSEKFNILMENWDKVKEYITISEQSLGTAEEKFGYYLEGLEAKTNSLIASLENLASTTISDELYASILDTSKEIVDLTADTGILKSTLIGLGVGGSLYAFKQLVGFLRGSAQELSNFSMALNLVDNGFTITTNDMQTLTDLTQGLSTSQMRLLLNTNNLTDAQKIALMVANGTEQELAEQQLKTWGLITAQQGATASTVTLTSVMRGLVATMAANPIFLVTTAVTLGVTAFNMYQSAVKKAEQRLSDLKTTLQDTTTELDTINTQIDDINAQIDELLAKDTLTLTDENDLKRLKEENEELRARRILLEAQMAERIQEVNAEVEKRYEKKFLNHFSSIIDKETGEELSYTTDENYLKLQIERANELLALKRNLTEEEKKELVAIKSYVTEQSNVLVELADSYEPITEEQKALKDSWEEIIAKSSEVVGAYAGTIPDITVRLVEKFATEADTQNVDTVIEEWINGLSNEDKRIMVTCDLEDASLEGLKRYLEEQKSEIENNMSISVSFDQSAFNKEIESYEDGYSKLIKAQEEWNESKAISPSTFVDLEKSGLLEYIKFTSEGLEVNTEKLLENAQSTKDKAVADLHAAMTSDLLAIAMGNTESISAEAQNVIAQLGENTETAGNQAMSSVSQWATLGDTISQVMADIKGEGYVSGISEEQKKQMSAVYDFYKNLATDISNIDITLGGSGSGGGSGSKTKSDFEETVDFFERRIDILNDAISRLKSNLENVTGSFTKNNLIDAQSSIYQEELRNYTDALAMYQKKAYEVLATLPDDIAEKVKNGAIDLTTFVGASSEAVVDAIGDYQNWADRVSEVKLQLIELQKTLSDLELEKINNVVSDFSSQFDLRDSVITNIDKHIALLEEQGQLIGASFYDAQIQQSQKQLALLEQEKIQLVEQINSALASGNVETGSEAWLEMVGVLSDVEGQITDCKKSIEEFSNEILELNWKSFERVQDTFSDLNTELENFVGLLDNIDVADDKGNWSTEAKTKLGLLSQQYELAVYQVGEYRSAIEELKKQYTNGDYSAIEFSEKLAELSDGMWDATNSANDLRDAIVDLNEQRVEVQIEGIEKEISTYEELIQAQIDALNAEKDLHDYRKSIEEQTKDLTDLERQRAAIELDNSVSANAQKALLDEKIYETKKKLEESEYEHSVTEQQNALEEQLNNFTEQKNNEIDILTESLKNQEQLISDSFETVKQNANLIGQQIAQIATEHGVIVSDSLISSWAQGENAIASYGTVLSSQSSAFIGNIMDVESRVWDLQSQANNTSTSLSGMFSTQADNLVSELSQSYYAEGNVLNMTNALHDSLVNTLESGYDVSKITSALKSIEDSARGAADEIGKLKEEENSANSRPVYAVVDRATGKTVATYNDIDEADAFIKSAKFADRNLLKQRELYVRPNKYASGTRSSKGNIIITDEEGQELKLPKLSSGNYTIANEGTQILTKVQTDNIFDWSKINPDALIPQFTKNVFNDIPKVVTRNVNHSQPVTIENKVIFTGAVNDANNFAKQIAQITDKQITKSWKEFTSELHR